MSGVEVVVELSPEVDHAIGESEVGAAAAISAPLLRDVRPEQKESMVLHASNVAGCVAQTVKARTRP